MKDETSDDLFCAECNCQFPPHRLDGAARHMLHNHGHDGDVKVVGNKVHRVPVYVGPVLVPVAASYAVAIATMDRKRRSA